MKSSIHAIMLTIGLIAPTAANADTVTMRMSDINPKTVIMPEIYGQFAEHLGSCIYGGLWVGPDSPIPNTSGYRNDVLQALRDLKVPVMRWPGGCFADEYHWRDGIGPAKDRPTQVKQQLGRHCRGQFIRNTRFSTSAGDRMRALSGGSVGKRLGRRTRSVGRIYHSG